MLGQGRHRSAGPARADLIAGTRRPTTAELASATAFRVPDVIAADLEVLFCGINPGLYSAAVQHHFARPGNRFWPALHRSRWTPRLYGPYEDRELLPLGLGITNLVERTTASAAELTVDELKRGRRRLQAKVNRYRVRWLAMLGITAYRAAFENPHARTGLQDATIAGARLWVLPNPSGLNGHHQLPQLVEEFAALRLAVFG